MVGGGARSCKVIRIMFVVVIHWGHRSKKMGWQQPKYTKIKRLIGWIEVAGLVVWSKVEVALALRWWLANSFPKEASVLWTYRFL